MRCDLCHSLAAQNGNCTNTNCARYRGPRRVFDMPQNRRDAIVEHMARTFFLLDYADGVEEGRIKGNVASCGEDWDNVAPLGSTPEARRVARLIVQRIEKVGTIESLTDAWVACSGRDDARFAHCLAMEAAGTGVGLNDDIPHGVAWTTPTHVDAITIETYGLAEGEVTT